MKCAHSHARRPGRRGDRVPLPTVKVFRAKSFQIRRTRIVSVMAPLACSVRQFVLHHAGHGVTPRHQVDSMTPTHPLLQSTNPSRCPVGISCEPSKNSSTVINSGRPHWTQSRPRSVLTTGTVLTEVHGMRIFRKRIPSRHVVSCHAVVRYVSRQHDTLGKVHISPP